MNDDLQKLGKGRPFKMANWIPALQDVLDSNSIVFLTDKDLVFLVNKNLSKEDRITERTFKNWKTGKFAPNENLGSEFLELIQEAMIKEKVALGEKLQNDKTGQWTRFAWILERKFEEFNLKQISENTNKTTQTFIQINAGSDEQKRMIENLINPEFKEVKPIQIAQIFKTQNNDDEELPF